MPKFDADVELLSTSHLYEADMVTESLKAAGIPYYRDQENFGGLRTAIVMPMGDEPGLLFRIIVPLAMETEARLVLDGMPLATSDASTDFWGFNSSSKVRWFFKAVAMVFLAGIAINIVWTLIHAIG